MHAQGNARYEGPWQVAAGTQGNHRLGVLFKNLRERSGLSPQQLADQAEVHVSFVRGIERGAQAPSLATARLMLACMKEHDRIQWMDSGPYDLLVRDQEGGHDVAFQFKAKVKGQNRRVPAGMTSLLLAFAEAIPRITETGEPDADVVRRGSDRQLRWSATDDDARFGRVVRLLAAADEDVLFRVESLLRDEYLPEQPSS